MRNSPRKCFSTVESKVDANLKYLRMSSWKQELAEKVLSRLNKAADTRDNQFMETRKETWQLRI